MTTDRVDINKLPDEFVQRAEAVVAKVKFQNYQFVVRLGHGGFFLQGIYDEPDVETKTVEKQFTRKWLLSPHMTDSEIVQTAFKLCMTSMEHRCREDFMFEEERVYSPHYNVNDLLQLCRQKRFDNRVQSRT